MIEPVREKSGTSVWAAFREYASNPVTWPLPAVAIHLLILLNPQAWQVKVRVLSKYGGSHQAILAHQDILAFVILTLIFYGTMSSLAQGIIGLSAGEGQDVVVLWLLKGLALLCLYALAFQNWERLSSAGV